MVTAFSRTASADPPALAIRLLPSRLEAGDRTALVVEVVLPPGPNADARLALTPSTEGTTLEVVRGRLLTADAQRDVDETGAVHLRFSVPVIAHAPGAAVLRIDVNAIVCAEVCASVAMSERFAVEVGVRGR